MIYNKRTIGNEYEDRAVRYLENCGYVIVERNFYCKQGEVDIIAKDKEYLVFVEVKYRKDTKKGYPSEAVNYCKKKRIIKAAKYYLYKNGYDNQAVRFDVISIIGDDIELIKDAFWIE